MTTTKTKFLFVTCCLEETRAVILKDVVKNLAKQSGTYRNNLTVFDNGSTVDWVVPMLQQNFEHVCVSNKNVGYWSAIDWWLQNVEQDQFTYIIESDMIHYAMEKLSKCESFLLNHDDVGSVRLHEYSVANQHLYDKNRPTKESKRTIWQSHVNKVTNERVSHDLVLSDSEVEIYTNNFLTQLPALNRTKTITNVFNSLKGTQFTEFDFQRMYWEHHQKTAILDGGMFHCDAGSYGKRVVTGSWTSPNELKKIGYKQTRVAEIMPQDAYDVSCTKPGSD